MFANPSSNRSKGQVWHIKELFFSLIIAVKMKIGPSSQNLAMVTVALVQNTDFFMVCECNACWKKANKFTFYPISSSDTEN